jgi:hypothetical protein
MTKQEILETEVGKISGQVFTIQVRNIEWDTDGEEIDDLPQELSLSWSNFDNDFDFDEDLSDWLSDEYGWLVSSYSWGCNTLLS